MTSESILTFLWYNIRAKNGILTALRNGWLRVY